MTTSTLLPEAREPQARQSPFHPGEQLIQTLAGVRDRAEHLGQRMIRQAMPDQHRDLFQSLPYLLMGSLDRQGRPWSSLLSGPPGFANSPDPRLLQIRADPNPPMDRALTPGEPVGLLGIELATRRRNRMNGRILSAGPGVFTIRVDQSFGNCPQYIQAREAEPVADAGSQGDPQAEGRVLSVRAAALAARSDTFFIASASRYAGADNSSEGVDISHRGGKPGFVRVQVQDGQTVMTIPDFRGNNAFNTFGNLALNPRAGLLFVDFESGALLSLTGMATVLLDDPAIADYYGAKRLLRFLPETGVLIENALPFRWSAPEPARQLAQTGDWPESG